MWLGWCRPLQFCKCLLFGLGVRPISAEIIHFVPLNLQWFKWKWTGWDHSTHTWQSFIHWEAVSFEPFPCFTQIFYRIFKYCILIPSRYLHGNKLTGPIPPELGNMTKLSYLWDYLLQWSAENFPESLLMSILLSCINRQLNDNQLVGSIPEELGKLEELFELWELLVTQLFKTHSIVSRKDDLMSFMIICFYTSVLGILPITALRVLFLETSVLALHWINCE